jgi:Spy/CpxP family protein refolding chaperone
VKSLPRQAAALFAATTLALSGAAAATLAAAAPAVAQTAPAAPAPAGSPAPQMHRAQLLQSLNLTTQQQAQVKQIMDNAKQQNQNADPETRHANMKAAWEQVRTTVLTPAQRTQLDAEIKAHRAAAGAHPSPSP